MASKIKDVVAYITGGAAGIGRAVAERIVCQGGKVVLADINSAGQKVAESLGDRAIFVCADVRNDKQVQESIRASMQKFGGVNVVVNSAGIVRYEQIYDFKAKKPHDTELFKSQMDINVYGTFNVIRYIVGCMAENQPDCNRQRGVIVNLASMMAFEPPPGLCVYGATKGAIRAMTMPLARSLAQKGIRVVSIGPGYIESPMTGVMSAEEKHYLTSMKLTPNRMGTCDEVAHLIQCVIENPLLNGDTIRIDMGWRYDQTKDTQRAHEGDQQDCTQVC